MIIRKKAYPRAGLVGNPSDGYHGKTIAFTFSNFEAEVILYETPDLEILPSVRDHSRFTCIRGLVDDVRLYGYYGGIRLLKAAVKRFYEYAEVEGISLHDRNFTLRYSSNIPHMVGLAGSSAIITACMRALMAFYGVSISRPLLANLILSVEIEELGISAGLQDRVAQVYQGLVFMDFDRGVMERHGYGDYDELDPACLPAVYIAYREDLSEGSEVFHNDMRQRYDEEEPEMLAAMEFWADLTCRVRKCLEDGNVGELGLLLDRNFDRRASVSRISEGNSRMIKVARSVGVSAKFTGSGGAIVGTCGDDYRYRRLEKALKPLNVRVFRPTIALATGEDAP